MADINDREYIYKIASNPERLRRESEDVVGYEDGDTGGHLDLEVELNLNAIAIGLGLENVEYEPERFFGLVHRGAHPDATVILTYEGQLTVVDAPEEDVARDAIISVIEELDMLGLYEEDVPSREEVAVSTLG